MKSGVVKTIKLFIGGEFVRSESGNSFVQRQSGKGPTRDIARLCEASNKDFRNAVAAARVGQSIWNKRTGYNRGQILYRMGEMFEGKRLEFCSILKKGLASSCFHSGRSTQGDTADPV